MNTSVSEIPVLTSRGVEYLSVKDIIRCEAISNYTRFYTKGKKWVTAKCLGAFEDQLAQFGFVRPNRSNLLNVDFIKDIERNTTIELYDGSRLKISRRRKKEFTVLAL